MQSNSLLFGIIGFILGGLLVSIAATTFEQPAADKTNHHGANTSMSAMIDRLEDKQGRDFDEAFVEDMILHHESAVVMAKLSENRAHDSEVKNLSKEIITAQQSEIAQMKQWQKVWGVQTNHAPHTPAGDTHN